MKPLPELIVLRTEKQKRYKTIDLLIHDADDELSYKAKGLHTYLISRPDGWEVRYPDLVNRSSDGKTSVESAVKELKEAGYLKINDLQDDSGQFTGSEWIVSETPRFADRGDFAPYPDYPDTDYPEPDNQPLTISSSSNKNSRSKEKPSPSNNGKNAESENGRVGEEELEKMAGEVPAKFIPDHLKEKMDERGIDYGAELQTSGEAAE